MSTTHRNISHVSRKMSNTRRRYTGMFGVYQRASSMVQSKPVPIFLFAYFVRVSIIGVNTLLRVKVFCLNMPKRKRIVLSVAGKRTIIQKFKQGKAGVTLAEEYEVTTSILSDGR